MSNPSDQMQTHTTFDVGQVLQVALTPANVSLATTVPANGSVNSGLIFTDGYKAFAFGCTSSQTGSISIQRYLDMAGTIKQGAALTASLTANTAQVCNCVDGLPFQSMIVTVANSTGTPATLTNTLLLLQAN